MDHLMKEFGETNRRFRRWLCSRRQPVSLLGVVPGADRERSSQHVDQTERVTSGARDQTPDYAK
jgi:hypothetical protein